MILVAALLCFAVLAGCGAPSDAGGPGTGGPGGGSSGGGLFQEPEKEPQRITDFTLDDIAGTWYGVSDAGTVYMMVVEQGGMYATEDGNGGTVRAAFFRDEVCNLTEWIAVRPEYELTEDGTALKRTEDGELIEKLDEHGNPVKIFSGGGEYSSDSERPHKVNIFSGSPYDDGSLHAVVSFLDDTGEKYIRENVVFTHDFSLPAMKVDREEGILSGIWYVYYEEEEVLFVAYPEGTFYMRQENAPVFGTYQLDGDTVTLTCRIVEGELYEGDGAVVTVPLLEDNSFDFGETTMPPVSGNLSGTWTYDPDDGSETSGVVVRLELKEDGTYILREDRNGKTTEEAGVYLYRSDTEAVLLSFFSDGYASFKIRKSITAEPDGSITMSRSASTKWHFTKD